MLLLLLDALGQMREIFHSALDLVPCRIELGAIHQWRCARQPPAGAVRDGHDHVQIPQQFTGYWWWLWLDVLLRF